MILDAFSFGYSEHNIANDAWLIELSGQLAFPYKIKTHSCSNLSMWRFYPQIQYCWRIWYRDVSLCYILALRYSYSISIVPTFFDSSKPHCAIYNLLYSDRWPCHSWLRITIFFRPPPAAAALRPASLREFLRWHFNSAAWLCYWISLKVSSDVHSLWIS